jgi:hypothetical protein
MIKGFFYGHFVAKIFSTSMNAMHIIGIGFLISLKIICLKQPVMTASQYFTHKQQSHNNCWSAASYMTVLSIIPL